MTKDESPNEKASPSAFTLKLVVLPAVVVLVLLLVGLSFAWLTAAEDNIDTLVAALSREGKPRWRAAVQLATLLRDPDKAELRADPGLARRLSAVLRKEIDAADTRQDSIKLRVYLCRALGHFTIPDPLPVLIDAAGPQRSEQDLETRCAAIEGLAMLASNVGPKRLRGDKRLTDALLAGSSDRQVVIRRTAAFALGVVGGDPAEARLGEMLADEAAEVRYNAATGLARHGNAACVGTLREMLDPNQVADDEAHGSWIVTNALRATGRLVESNATADFRVLESAVERLTQDDQPARVRVEAVGVLEKFRLGKK